MIVKSDQDRVRALLTEAITVLCRKRLSFKSQLSVEGLIGITLDSDDIFLVSIKELVLNSSGEESLAEPPTSVQGSTPAMMDSAKVRSGRQRKSTPRHLSVVSPPLHYDINFPVEEEEEECNWQLQDGTDIDDLSPVTNLFHRAEIQRDGNQLRGLVAKDEPLEYRVREENGIDAPLNLSNTSSSHAASPRVRVNPDEKPHRDITPQKRKRNDSDDTDSQCSSVVSASAKRPSSISSISCPSPAYRTTPTLELVTIKQEPNIESASINNNHHHFDPAPTNGYVFVQPAQEDAITKGFSNGVMKDTGNILAGRTNLIESAIWQRLASPITPLQLSSPMMPSQANFVCPKCGRSMQHLGGWTRHVERCGTPRFCNVCGKQFKTSNSLRVHRFHYHRPPQSNAKAPAKGASKGSYKGASRGAPPTASSQPQLLGRGVVLAPSSVTIKPKIVETAELKTGKPEVGVLVAAGFESTKCAATIGDTVSSA